MTENKSAKTIKIKIFNKCNICKKNKSKSYFSNDITECNKCVSTSKKCTECKYNRLYKFFMDNDGNEMPKCIPCNIKINGKGHRKKKSTAIFKINDKDHKCCKKCPFVGNISYYIGDRGKIITICPRCSINKKGYDKKSRDANKIEDENIYITINGIDHKYCYRHKKYEIVAKFLDANGKETAGCRRCLNNEMRLNNKNKCKHGGGTRKECPRCPDICSYCKKKFTPEEGDISTCHTCRYYSNCTHGYRLKTNCRKCMNETRKMYKRRNKCSHGVSPYSCSTCNPVGHLAENTRKRVYDALKKDKIKHTVEYLGCDMHFYRDYIAQQFIGDMSWENHGEWHVDHIMPLQYKDPITHAKPTIEQLIERLHYSNTQPLWAHENCVKGNHWVG